MAVGLAVTSTIGGQHMRVRRASGSWTRAPHTGWQRLLGNAVAADGLEGRPGGSGARTVASCALSASGDVEKCL
jgi:hypothetical protein